MKNGFHKEPGSLPEPDVSQATNQVGRKKWSFNAPTIIQLASSKLLKSIKITMRFVIGVLAGCTQLASRLSKRMQRSTAIVALVATMILAGHSVSAQLVDSEVPEPLASLKTVAIPQPDNLGDFIKDKVAAIALGKSLFWDMQVGSDGLQSCASCHFHAGADNRAKNQLSPGLLRVNADGTPNPDPVVNSGLNYILKPSDFPFHKLQDPGNRSSTVLADTNDVASSQGMYNSQFVDVILGNAQDKLNQIDDPVFNIGGIEVRRVEPRNSPTVINAVFNFRNFWDGRAQDIFNGVNEFGLRDPEAKVIRAKNSNQLEEAKISLKNSSLASQAVGPPLSSFEMSAAGRTFEEIGDKFGAIDQKSKSSGKGKKSLRKLGKKLTALRPLGKQRVHPEDSVLGKDSRAPQPGLKSETYEEMIKDAFKSEWWKSDQIIQVDAEGRRTFLNKPNRSLATNEYTLVEYNFPLFFGLAVQMYESTLVSDNAPIDQYLEGNRKALSASQIRGKALFEGKAKCINCHGGAEFTNASVKNVQNERLERMLMGNGQEAIYDNGFYNIGVRPTLEDLGVGGKDPFGNPLSESRVAQKGLFKQLLGAEPNLTVGANERIAVDGAFKTPGIRNIELTAPYFHNGGQLTLLQLVDFYNRGGDFHEQNIDDLDPDIRNLGLSAQEKTDLVEFMKALTDERVRYDKAPFDHPQLFITNGHPGDTTSVTNDGTGKATDELIEIPAVGRKGGKGTPNFPGS